VVSRENVELIRSLMPGPEVDLVALFTDDQVWEPLAGAIRHLVDPGFFAVQHVPGAEPSTHEGLDGFRANWLDWLVPWASYRTEIEQLIDAGASVVAIVCDYGRREPGAPEVRMKTATVWTLSGGLIVRVDSYPGGHADALASVGLAE
jgi:SnoaL-like domain